MDVPKEKEGWEGGPSILQPWSLHQPSRVWREGGASAHWEGRSREAGGEEVLRGRSRVTLASEAEVGFVFNQVSIQKRTVEKYKPLKQVCK